jgi:hypothetical protein
MTETLQETSTTGSANIHTHTSYEKTGTGAGIVSKDTTTVPEKQLHSGIREGS